MIYLIKLKVDFKNTIFWCWIWALTDTNHFYQSELVEFKASSELACISMLFSNLGRYFQKISITYNLGQNCWDKIEGLFFSEKKPSPLKSMLFAKILGFWQQNLAIFNIKKRSFWNFLNLLTAQLTSQQILSRMVGFNSSQQN